MEIKRKKITAEEIFSAESKLVNEMRELTEAQAEAFRALGYEIVTELQQKEEETEKDFSVLSLDGEKTYPIGYVSRALLTIRREETEKTPAESDAEAAASEAEPIEETDAEQLECDEMLRASSEALERSVAFTEVMLVRAYKSFWTEWVSIANGLDEVRADLSEFLEVLKNKAENA